MRPPSCVVCDRNKDLKNEYDTTNASPEQEKKKDPL